LTQNILPALSTELLRRMADGQICTGIYMYQDAAGKFAYRFEPPVTTTPLSSDERRELQHQRRTEGQRLSDRFSMGTTNLADTDHPWHHPKGRVRPNIKKSAKKSKGIMGLFKK
jgi:hypothetical protein